MHIPLKALHLAGALALAATAAAQPGAKTTAVPPNPENEPAPVHPVPSERQMAWNDTEFYAFFHFGMNTFTGREWGIGDEDEKLFAPKKVPRPLQWLKACKKAGMKGGIAVVKHHDGFCLWPTATTTHSVARSEGNGRLTNIPRDFAAAARKLGMKYGFYVSPWDRSNGKYGTQAYIDDVFIPQCEELAKYGADQFEMWFDGAGGDADGRNGYYGGAYEQRKVERYIYYDVPNLRYKIHSLAPMCVMWGIGGEARWIGNERGVAGETNWATHAWAENGNNETGEEGHWLWNAGESDAMATTGGWFWKKDEKMKPAETLFKMYLETVGRNATLILNLPPDDSGELPRQDVDTLLRLGKLLRQRLGKDLALKARATATQTRRAGATRSYAAANLTDGNPGTYWATDDGVVKASATIDLGKARTIHYVALQEYIRKGQRVRSFNIECSPDGTNWEAAAPGVACTTIGRKRIVPLNGSTEKSYGKGTRARYVRVNITDSKACPLIQRIAIY